MGSRNRARIAVELGALKPLWQARCVHNGVSAGEGIRRLVAEALDIAHEPPDTSAVLSAPSEPFVRIGVGLMPAELQCIKGLAHVQGFTANRWIAALIRAHLTGEPQLGNREMMLLAESNRQLAAIRTRLGELARNTGEGHHVSDWEHSRVVILTHLRFVAQLLQTNLDRWSR
ncbi:hypothetical protein [Burkholderia contaminans]|uniref:Plasmid-related protein n=1 Tax=Burkholderia contaminans TaxID=488447 RepID=A0A6P3BSS6_9BURK|nr:plasmid-related protein [Burkholderia contaminans]